MPSEQVLNDVEERLLSLAQAGLAKILRDHPDDTVAYFGFYCNAFCVLDPDDEGMRIDVFFETLDNALLWAKRKEMWFIRDFKKAITEFDKINRYALVATSLPDLDFGYKPQMLDSLEFRDWNKLFELPRPHADVLRGENSADDYWVLVFWKVFERLIAANSFDALRKSAPLRLGYEFHDCSRKTIRMVNWPNHKGPRV